MRIALIIISIIALAGCASTAGGKIGQNRLKPDTIFVESTPPGATVLVNDEVKGITPVDVKLLRSEKSQRLKVVRDGFRPEEITLTPTVEEVGVQKENMVINSTAFFGGVGLVAGLAVGAPVTGLLGGSTLGLIVGLSQDEQGLETNYEYSPESINIKLIPSGGE
ncbi:MAG: PEGA domain-containing protein [Planctomycetota bacterium]